MILCALLVAFAAAPAATSPEAAGGLLISDACEDIRERRAASVRRYTEALFRVASKCAALGLRDEGGAIIDRIVRLHAPEPLRRPWRSSDAAAETDPPGTGAPETGSPETAEPVTSGEAALSEEIRARIREAREELAAAPAHLDSSGGRESAASTIDKSEQRARRDFVSELSRLANRCVDDGFPALGWDLVLWTLQFDRENPRLRKALRQKQWTDERTGETRWYAPFDYAEARRGKIDDPDYGWVTPGALERLRSGHDSFDGRWLPKARVAELRRHWSGRWLYETEHFAIHTNADREEVVRFGREIERFYSFLFRVLADFYAIDDPAEATRLVLRGGRDLGERKLRLHYHRSRESYLWELENDRVLRAASRELTAGSAGFYWGRNGRAYFYSGPFGPDFTTVFHEVTHQILGETYPTGARPPAWLVEGIAVFMERPVVRGRRGAERLVAGAEPPPGIAARDRPPGTEPVNINAFIRSRGTNESFHEGRRHEHYATAGAIVHFFLLHRGGVHRRAFLRYARAAWRNDLPEEPTPSDALYKYLGLTEDELQTEWEAFNRRPDVFDL